MNLEYTGDVIIGNNPSDKKDYRFFNAYRQAYFDVPGGAAGYGNRIYGGTINENTIYELEIGNYYVKNLQTGSNIISGSSLSYTGSATITLNGSSGCSKNRWYYVKIYNGSTLQRHLVPMVIDGEGFMYDKVTNTYF